ncbi:hypothetical protein QW131_11235 [Roseibium salinum]|nr:hypothetical protein [Roseibium salinum]
MTASADALQIHPLTSERWKDLVDLFRSRARRQFGLLVHVAVHARQGLEGPEP